MIIAMHQPDLLPYSGFWHKMAKADVFEIGIHYQFTKRGYQRRVRMRDAWATVPVVGEPFRAAVKDVQVDPARARKSLCDTIYGRYAAARYWKVRGPELLALVEDVNTDRLWQLNLHLIIGVRDMLGIRTPLSIGSPLKGSKSEAIVHALSAYGDDVIHLSGPGARTYMGEGREFADAGIELRFTNHRPVTGDSIVSVLMDHPDPLAVVMGEGR